MYYVKFENLDFYLEVPRHLKDVFIEGEEVSIRFYNHSDVNSRIINAKNTNGNWVSEVGFIQQGQ